MQYLLDAAQNATKLRGEGAIAAFGEVVFGRARLALSSWGVVLVGDPSQTTVITQNFQSVQIPVTQTGTLEEMCALGCVPWKEILMRTKALEVFRPFGAGIEFECTVDFNSTKFISIIERYNCSPTMAQKIAQDLVMFGKRSTTVQSHLVSHWDEMQSDLMNVGVSIKRVLPRLNQSHSTTSTNISEKVESLRKQFKR